MIVVEDSGIGIDKKVIPILFQAFQQADSSTSREHGGTGLGLAISKRFVELMEGTVQLDSELGKGTKITVTLPFQKNPRPLPKQMRRPSQRLKSHSSRSITPPSVTSSPPLSLPPTPLKEIIREDMWILLAEDNPLNAEIFEKGLRKMRFNVRRVANGLEAIKAMEERQWNICLMDMWMPMYVTHALVCFAILKLCFDFCMKMRWIRGDQDSSSVHQSHRQEHDDHRSDSQRDVGRQGIGPLGGS